MAEAATKSKTEYTSVTMTDGRVVEFPGKRKVLKDTIIDHSKVETADGVVQLQTGAISIRMDFRNGETRTLPLPLSLLAQFAGHGGEQKFGDELATTADKPLTEEDMVIAIDDLYADISKGTWGRARAAGGGGVSGAGIVLQAVLEASNEGRPDNGKPVLTMQAVKEWVQKRLDAELSKPEDQRLTRRALYDSFRSPNTKTGVIIKRLEDAKAVKAAKVDANVELEGIGA